MKEGAPDCGEVDDGPDGGRGLYATWKTGDVENDPHFGFAPAKQRWVQSAAIPELDLRKGSYWVGIEVDRPPRPTDLQFKNQVPGVPLALKDGEPWFIPKSSLLPGLPGLDVETGEYSPEVDPQYAKFCKDAAGYAKQLHEAAAELDGLMQESGVPTEEKVSFTCVDLYDFCCDTLGLNYRLNMQIVDALRRLGHPLLGQETMTMIVALCTDFVEIGEVRAEKKSDDTVSILVG